MQAATTENVQPVIKQLERPVVIAGTIVIKNKYNGIKYADKTQIAGFFSPDAQVSPVVGEGVADFQVGDRVVALAADSRAEFSLVKGLEIKTVKIPDGVTDKQVVSLTV